MYGILYILSLWMVWTSMSSLGGQHWEMHFACMELIILYTFIPVDFPLQSVCTWGCILLTAWSHTDRWAFRYRDGTRDYAGMTWRRERKDGLALPYSWSSLVLYYILSGRILFLYARVKKAKHLLVHLSTIV